MVVNRQTPVAWRAPYREKISQKLPKIAQNGYFLTFFKVRANHHFGARAASEYHLASY